MPYDLLIKNGMIVDGSGASAFRGDLAVHDGKIVEVGAISGVSAPSSTPLISSLPRGLLTRTPTMMHKSAGTHSSRVPHGTASLPSSWGIAASVSRRANLRSGTWRRGTSFTLRPFPTMSSRRDYRGIGRVFRNTWTQPPSAG